jgi:hypothetical protein
MDKYTKNLLELYDDVIYRLQLKLLKLPYPDKLSPQQMRDCENIKATIKLLEDKVDLIMKHGYLPIERNEKE